MERTFLTDREDMELYDKAEDFLRNGDHIKALMTLEDMISANDEDMNLWILQSLEGTALEDLERIDNTDMKIIYLLGAVECFSYHEMLAGLCAFTLYKLAEELGSVLYYKQCFNKANEALSSLDTLDSTTISSSLRRKVTEKPEKLKILIKGAESMIALSKTTPLNTYEPRVYESKNRQDSQKHNELRSYWLGLDITTKRDFMKVSISDFLSFVEGTRKNKEEHDVLEEVLASAKKDRKWTFWTCRTLCLTKCSSSEECRTHLEQHHKANFKAPSENLKVDRIGKNWTSKILDGGWEPLDTINSVKKIKDQPADVKGFASKNGWSKEWTLAVDERRSKLLNDIKLLLVSFCKHKVLSCSVRDWIMSFPARLLEKLEVSKQNLDDSHLLETPQSICFLECDELNQILDFLKSIKCKRNDGTDVVCMAVDNRLKLSRVKEKIDVDHEFSFLLLDKRLLKTNITSFDDDVKIYAFDPNLHYAKAHAQGDDIISWLVDYSSVDKNYIREQNLDAWLAVLRIIQFTCRTLRIKYEKKEHVLNYRTILNLVEKSCGSEHDRRSNIPEDQWNRYASVICNICENHVPRNPLTTKTLYCTVLDVLIGSPKPTFYFPDLEACLYHIRDLSKSVSDDIVLKSIDLLKSVINQKLLLMDSKILLIDNSRISLLNTLTRLSVFDNRSYILQMLKPFLLDRIVNMQSKAKAEAMEADLLREEEKKKSQAKKKKNKSKEGTSMSRSSPLDKSVEHEPSASHKLKGDSMESEDTVASESRQHEISSNTNQEETTKVDIEMKLKDETKSQSDPRDTVESEDTFASEISPNTVSQEEVAKDMQNMTGEDSMSEHLESPLVEAAAKCNSAFDMTIKALLNINVCKKYLMHNRKSFHDDPEEEQVLCALQDFFSAFVSAEMKGEGVYSFLLSELLAALEVVHSMSNDAAEVLVDILELWRCWKNAERESLVTRLFTLEENETMICEQCRRKPNYTDQSSYGIVMAADSIRDMKCALGNRKFVDILKEIRKEFKMLCDTKTGGCGTKNVVRHIMIKCPPIFTIVLTWKKNETEEEIFETTKALDWEIDLSKLYEGLTRDTKYRLVSMVGWSEEEEHICLAYERNRWVKLGRMSLEGEVVGKWKSVVKLCGERKVRPEILFYEAVADHWHY